MDVTITKNSRNERNAHTAIVLGAYIVWGCRKYLFQKIHEIKEAYPTMELLMVNTDSIICEVPESATIQNISEQTGQFKNQISDCFEILNFYALSPLCYNINYKNFENQEKQLSKISGFKMNTVLSGVIETKTFERLLYLAAVHEKIEKIPIEQIRKIKVNSESVAKRCVIHLSNNLDRTRFVKENFVTKPFGYVD